MTVRFDNDSQGCDTSCVGVVGDDRKRLESDSAYVGCAVDYTLM